MMGRIAPREVPLSPSGQPNGPTKYHKSRKQAIFKSLRRMSSIQNSQFAILIIDAKGRATVETSEAFHNRRDALFPEQLIKEASDITVARANEIRSRKRNEEQNGPPLEGKAGEGENVIDDDEDFEEDADHEDDDGLNGGLDEAAGGPIPKQLLHYADIPPPPLELFEPSPPRIRKRTSQPEKPEKRRRRSSTKQSVLHRSDSTSGESSTVTATGCVTYRPLVVSNSEAVTIFFETRFRQMQQLTCKVVAKAWIKVIEPKKQSNFPYNRGEESKPAWWPAGARHKEPDHLMKPERLLLLMTMLRCRRVPVSKLEMATAEVAAHIEECRIGLLEEIYRVAKMEERYVAGTLPADATCYVAASADKVVSNTKPQSPKTTTPPQPPPPAPPSQPPQPSTENQEVLPASSSSTNIQETGRIKVMDLQKRPRPQQSPTEVVVPVRPQPIQFSAVVRSQPNIQPGMNYSSQFMASAQGSDESYIKSETYVETSQPFTPAYYARASMSYAHSHAAPPMPRRANSIPQIPHSPYNGWQISMFPQYNTTTQQQSQHSHHASHSLGPSSPPTTVSNASYTPMLLLPPPLPPIHQHQPHGTLSAHHDIAVTVAGDRSSQYDTSRGMGTHIGHSNVSFSEFLESPMPERAYELGGVTPGLGEDDLVAIRGDRVQDQGPGMSGSKDIPHN